MKSRLLALASAVLVIGAVAAPAAQAASTTVVISQAAFRGPNGGNDELIQIRNVSATAQNIGGWTIVGTNAGGTTGVRATVPTGTSLPIGKAFLFVNGAASGYGDTTVPGDIVYTTGITDTGGVQLRNAAGAVIDAVGHTGLTANAPLFKEGAGLPFPSSTPASNATAFLRQEGGTKDTDINEADFTGPQVRLPENCGAQCAAADPCPPGTDGITPITTIQALDAPCENRTVKVRGIVTGIDDLYGSNFDNIFRSDSGLWVQQAERPQGTTTSTGIFIAGIRRDAANPAGVIGSDVTINGRVETKFGLVQIVPPGVGQTNQNAQLVNLTDAAVGVVNSTGNALPAPVLLDKNLSESQDPDTRPYYRSLQGMRVRLPEAIATGGGTTKFRDVFVEPGTTAERLFRKNNPAAITSPWSDAPDELGISGEGGAGNPADPRMPWRSSTQVDLDLFDIVRNVVGPLTFGFNFYKVMPQPGGEPSTIERGPINGAGSPTAPPAPPNSLRVASFNVENLFPIGKFNDGHEITEAEYAERVHALVLAIRDRLREPDVIAVQEVAVFADGANALTGLAQALGNYTGYIEPNNDVRGIATGFLVKNGTTASGGRLLDANVTYNERSEGPCDLAGGKLFDRAPYALDLKKGDIAFTAMSNHFASQSHENACRIAEAEAIRRQTVTLQQAGRHVLVAGDLNDFEFSDALGRMTQGNTLANLWFKAPAGLAYSYKFNGHLQTLDHILVTAGLESRVTDMRYVHFDNDVYERSPTDGTGISDHDPPLATFELRGASTSTPTDISGSVPATLSLTIGTPPSLGTFRPGVAADYMTTTTATVTSTGEDSALSVLDASSDATGRLVNGNHALVQPLQVSANSGAFAPLRSDNGPLSLKSWAAPVSVENVTIGFKQSIGATEGLRTGSYSKTLTFTLSSTTP